MAYCDSCNRSFVDDDALGKHRNNSSRHAYCGRCNRYLANPDALQQHLRDSSRHNNCDTCSIDFESEQGLDKHLETVHFRCSSCKVQLSDHGQLQQHDVDVHNMCITCRGFFQNQTNLNNVRPGHLLSDILVNNHSTEKHMQPKVSAALDAIELLEHTRPWCCILKIVAVWHTLVKMKSRNSHLNAIPRTVFNPQTMNSTLNAPNVKSLSRL